MGRVLCVDYGRSRVGVAVSDPLGRTAQPHEVFHRRKGASLVEDVARVAAEMEVEEIVVGLPLRLDGTKGVAAEAATQFADALRGRCSAPVVLFDERLSTKEATRGMRAAGVSERQQRGVVDKVAAAVVLQTYLDSRNRDQTPMSEAAGPVTEERERPHPPADPATTGGRAAAKRRAAEKRERKRADRQRWRRDAEDGYR